MELLKRLFWVIAQALFVVAIPLAIITHNVTSMAFDPSFYEYGQLKYGAMKIIGLDRQQIHAASQSLVDFFSSRGGSLVGELQKQGLSNAFFSQRETIHLQDVKGLIVGIDTLQQWTFGYIVLFLVGSLLLSRGQFLRRGGRSLITGAGLTLALLAVFAILSLTDFSNLFLMFHQVSFDNDLWVLDPRVDKLISMFPPDFFNEAALKLAAYAALESVGLAALGWALLAIDKRGGTVEKRDLASLRSE